MMIVGMPGLSRGPEPEPVQPVVHDGLPAHRRQRPPGHGQRRPIDILTNLEAIAVDQDPLGVQGRVVWNDGDISLWAGKPLFDGGQAVLVLSARARPGGEDRLGGARLQRRRRALCPRPLDARDERDPHAGGVTVSVGPDDAAFLRLSKKNDFPIPPILVADTYRVSLRSTGAAPGNAQRRRSRS
ncbi:MAG: hypothetical protein M0C28_47685 [Candidatus Moduliflexus flocculans]|nr:hypothetical protein [Candidatus Moduliflexus flocculans]